MASSIPEAIMPPIFSSCNFLVDVPLSSSTLPRWRQVRVQAEGLHFSLQGAVILSQTTAINDGLPQLLFPVWSESNHRMTSMWWWVLCKVPPKVTRPAEVFSVRCQITRCNVFFAPVRCDLKEAKPKTFIRFWCQMLTNRDYLMTHLNCHYSTLVVELSHRRRRRWLYLLSHSLRHLTSRLTSSCHMI